jgi:hypothetical protein
MKWKVKARQFFYVDYEVEVEADDYQNAIMEAYNSDALEITPETIRDLNYESVDYNDAEIMEKI